MDWPEDVAAELPAPRDDEPASLRRDIADELSDHLCCALNRELHATADETQARQNVLSRFGDPTRVARRLWFDAMKERIMSQRITLILSAVMAVACLVAVGLVWRIASQSQQVNRAILEKLDALAAQPPARAAESLEWLPVKVRLTLEVKRAKPADGYSVYLSGSVYGGGADGAKQLVEKTGPEGTVDFGLVHVGDYSLTVVSPWGDACYQTFSVRPGNPDFVEIVCPAAAPPEVTIHISVNRSDELSNKELWLICRFSRPHRQIDGETWFTAGPKTVAVSPSGSLFDFDDRKARAGYLHGGTDSVVGLKVSGKRLYDWDDGELRPREHLRWKGPDSILQEIAVAVRASMAPSERELAAGAVRSKPPEIEKLTELCAYSYHKRAVGSSGGFDYLPGVIDAAEPPKFRAKPGDVNHWTITLPAELVADVQKKLSQAANE